MKSSISNYKSYPFPVRLTISYVILSIVGIVLLDTLANIWITNAETNGIFEEILAVVIGIVICIVAIFIELVVFHFLLKALRGNKIYRGIGLYRFVNSFYVICPVVFVGIIVLLKLANVEYSFFNGVVLFLECTIPPCLTLDVKYMLTERCERCGLFNTFYSTGRKTENLGTHHKFHTEGGYYQTNNATGRISNSSIAPEVYDIKLQSRQYIPKTAVYDGAFEKKRTVITCCCCVCSCDFEKIRETERKIN